MFYKISSDPTCDYKVFVSKRFAEENSIINSESSIFLIVFGQRKYSCEVVPLDNLEDNIIILSEPLMNYLYLQKNISYQVIVGDNKIHIGPIIGLLFKKNIRKLSKAQLNSFLKYTLKYPQVNGILCTFTPECINFKENTVDGFYFDVQDNKWVRSTLPIPDTIFRRASLNKSVFNKLSTLTGNKVFNSYFFNKWEFWKIGLKHDIVKNHIPYTEKIVSAERIVKLLEDYPFLYLKPINGTFSRGIIRLENDGEKYLAKTNLRVKPFLFSNKEDLIAYLSNQISNKTYLAQQGVDVIKLTGGYTSLRVIMQKNQLLKWQCTGIIARIGESRGISSNYNSWGYGLTFEDYLCKSHQLSEEETSAKRQEVISLCTSICRMLEVTWGNYGDVGIDVGIDNNLRVWVFEVNKTHMHYIPLKINDYVMYDNVKTMPIKYATALSGFRVQDF